MNQVEPHHKQRERENGAGKGKVKEKGKWKGQVKVKGQVNGKVNGTTKKKGKGKGKGRTGDNVLTMIKSCVAIRGSHMQLYNCTTKNEELLIATLSASESPTLGSLALSHAKHRVRRVRIISKLQHVFVDFPASLTSSKSSSNYGASACAPQISSCAALNATLDFF